LENFIVLGRNSLGTLGDALSSFSPNIYGGQKFIEGFDYCFVCDW
jgi:hypothetical protein